jgi:hypothetical protein
MKLQIRRSMEGCGAIKKVEPQVTFSVAQLRRFRLISASRFNFPLKIALLVSVDLCLLSFFFELPTQTSRGSILS